MVSVFPAVGDKFSKRPVIFVDERCTNPAGRRLPKKNISPYYDQWNGSVQCIIQLLKVIASKMFRENEFCF